MQQIQNSKQNRKAHRLERFSIRKSKMVHHIDLSWNQIEASILLIYEKLVNILDYESRYRATSSDLLFPDTPHEHRHLPKRLEDP